MSTTPPLFDMSKATPINQSAPAPSGKALFDMSKATPISEAGDQPALRMLDPSDPYTKVDDQGNVYYKGKRIDPMTFSPAPPAVGTAAIAAAKALPAVGQGIVQGAKAMLPAAGATVEDTAANVTKWALQNGLKLTGTVGAAYWLLHKLLGGKSE